MERTNTLTTAPRTAKFTVRLSSSQPGKEGAPASPQPSLDSPLTDRINRSVNHRTQLIELLRKADYRVKNGKGTQVVELGTMQKKSITVSDAFVFLPRPTLAEVFKLTSLIVGYQTNDPELRGKPTALLQLDATWSPVLDIFRHLEVQGMISAPDQLFTVLDSVDKVAPTIKTLAGKEIGGLLNGFAEQAASVSSEDCSDNQQSNQVARQNHGSGPGHSTMPAFHVGVFCSASTREPSFKRSAYILGQNLARKGMGVVFGAGSSGMMGELARGSLDQGGYLRGANISRIAQVEGLPPGLQDYWEEGSGITDIYQRLLVMVAHSDAFILMPGGAGTLQELLALLLLLRDNENPLMRHRRHKSLPKRIVLVNQRSSGSGRGFYDPVIDLIQLFGYKVDEDFQVVNDETEAVNELQTHPVSKGWAIDARQRPSETGWANV